MFKRIDCIGLLLLASLAGVAQTTHTTASQQGNNTFTGNNTHAGTETFNNGATINSPGVTASSATISGALKAQSVSTCIPTDSSGTLNMSAQIQACITSAISNNASKIIIPCGTYLLSTTIDMTNKPGLLVELCAAQFEQTTQGTLSGIGQTTFLCNTGGVCWDFTGSGDGGMRNFRMFLAGTGITTPSTIGILRGRDNASGGLFCNSERQKFENFVIIDFTAGGFNTTANGGRGYIGIYNYGSESGKLENFGILTATPLVYTNSNVASVSSPFQTIGTGCVVTMTAEQLDTGTLDNNQGAGPINLPNIEADGTANMSVNNVTFIGGNAAIKFEGTLPGLTGSAYKWHVVANQESPIAGGSFLSTTGGIQDSFFHIESAPTQFIKAFSNNLKFTNNAFLFNTEIVSTHLIDNIATGTQFIGGTISFGDNTGPTLTSSTLIGARVIAPNATKAQLKAMFNGASGYEYVASDGAGHIGAWISDVIRQLNTSTSLEIQDFAGNDHFVIGIGGTNTFLSGNGAGGTIFGSGKQARIDDTTATFNLYNNITATDQGVLPIQGTPQHLSGQTAALAATSLFTSPAAGVYRVCFGAFTTTSGSGTTATVSILWTDAGGAKTFTSATWALNSVTITGQVDGCKVIRVASGNIQISVAGTFGTSAYALDAWVEREN